MRYPVHLPLLLVMTGLAGCATEAPPVASPQFPSVVTPQQLLTAQPSFSQYGLASIYGGAHDGKATASGERFNQHELTAAHRTLAFRTVVCVTNLENGQMVEVEITDRGPRIKDCIIDLSSAAADLLGMQKKHLARVRLDVFREDQAGRG